jgi:HAD superfamily hydrolase (TIGR01490 family)
VTEHQRVLAEIAAGPSGSQIGAFFDLDGTLIAGYSAVTFAQEQLRRFDVSLVEVADLVRAWLDVGLQRAEEETLVATAVRALGGRDEAAVSELSQRLFEKRLAGSIHPEARDLVQTHQRQGHTVAIASSATRYQVEPLARDLGIEHVLCTELEVVAGRLTGRVKGPILWGRGKAEAVARFAAEHRLDLARSYGYGNRDEDVRFLELVGRPRPVNPGRSLARVAAERGWPVLRFRSRERPDALLLARNAATLTGAGVVTLAGLGIGLALNRNRRQAANLITSVGPDVVLPLAGIDVTVSGEEHLWSSRPAVFIFNHQSYLDAVVIARLLRQDFTSVAKKELANTPVLGALGRLGNVAFVDRDNPAQARRALTPVVEKLRQGVSVVIAPEGTRSATHRVGPFKKGAFHVAMQAGVPIVPVVFRNTGDLLWKSSFVVRPGQVEVAVLPPISVAGWQRRELDARVARVRQLFVDTLSNWPDQRRSGTRSGPRRRRARQGSADGAGTERRPSRRRTAS